MVSSFGIYQLHLLGLQFVHDDQGVLKGIICNIGLKSASLNNIDLVWHGFIPDTVQDRDWAGHLDLLTQIQLKLSTLLCERFPHRQTFLFIPFDVNNLFRSFQYQTQSM